MPADEHFEARTWGNGRLSGTPTSGGGLTDLEVRIGQALAEVPTQAEIDTALESVGTGADLGDGLKLGPGYDVVLALGQSNQCGRGSGTDPRLDWADPRIDQYGRATADGVTTYANQISAAVDPLSYPENRVSTSGPSPALTFARRYVRTLSPNRRVLIIPAAWGGTGLLVPGGSSGKQWSVGFTPSSNSLYALAVAQTQAAITEAGPGNHRIVAALWVQGEQDGDNSIAGSAYRAALDTLIDSLRIDLATPNLPFIIGQLVPRFLDHVSSPTRRAINNEQLDTPRRKHHSAFAYGPPASDLSYDANDANHYSSAGLRFVGRSMWAAYPRALANATGAAPVAVAAPTVTQAGTTATVSWAQSAGRATDYVLRYRAQGAGSWTTATRTLPLHTSFAVSGLTLGITYEFQVAVVNEQGTSAFSPTAPFAMATIPGQVTGLAAGTPGAYIQPLTWTATPGATSYLIEYKAAASGTWLTGPTVTTNAGQVTGLLASTSYNYRVSAINAAGTGTASATTTNSTSAPVSMSDDVGIMPFEAYGLRRLVTGYSGPVVTVVRSTDGTSQDIGVNGSGDFDSAAAVTFSAGGDLAVSRLWDQTGNGRHLDQATAANRPKLATAGVVETQGGRPCITFDGSNDYLWRAGAGLYDAGACTVMRVEQCKTTGTGVTFAESRSTGQNGRYLAPYQNNGSYQWTQNTDAAAAAINLAITATMNDAIHQVTAWDSGSQIAFYQDQTTRLTPTAYTRGVTTLDRTAIGGWLTTAISVPFLGKISEVVAWSTALAPADRVAGEANQKSYYGTP